MKLALYLPNFRDKVTVEELEDLTSLAEQLDFDSVWTLDRIVVPGLTHWQHPSFFAYFPANTSYASILGELASAGLGINGMSWVTSPACTEIETHVLDWMVDLLGLPGRFRSTGPGGGVIQDTASSATLCAILAARERAGAGSDLVAYASAHAHSAVEKVVVVRGPCPRGGDRRLFRTMSVVAQSIAFRAVHA